jgi:hypothetical protein
MTSEDAALLHEEAGRRPSNLSDRHPDKCRRVNAEYAAVSLELDELIEVQNWRKRG